MQDKKIQEILERVDAKLNPPLWKSILDFIGRYFFTIGFFIIGLVMMFSILGMYWAVESGINHIKTESKELITDIQTKINKIENLTEEEIDKIFKEQIQHIVDNAVSTTKDALYEEIDLVREEIRTQLQEALRQHLTEINLFDRQN